MWFPATDISLAKVAKPAELIVNRVVVLVVNVIEPRPFADIASGIVTSFPATNIEPADILVNAAIGPTDTVPDDVIEPEVIPPPIVTEPNSDIDNLVVGVAPVRIPKLLVPFVVIVIGIFASLPCAFIELPVILNCAVAVPIAKFPTTDELPVIVVAPADNVPGILTPPVEPFIVIRVVPDGACKNIPPVPLVCMFKLILASVPAVAI